jgi:hypothetical protein
MRNVNISLVKAVVRNTWYETSFSPLKGAKYLELHYRRIEEIQEVDLDSLNRDVSRWHQVVVARLMRHDPSRVLSFLSFMATDVALAIKDIKILQDRRVPRPRFGDSPFVRLYL